jgi:sugar phosphate isomerase/epimerase
VKNNPAKLMHIVSYDRRRVLKTGVFAATGLLAGRSLAAEPGALFSAMGMSGSLDRAAFYKQQGAEFLTIGTAELLVPDQGDEVFEAQLAKARQAPLPVLACNGFIRPPHLRCVGPQANHDTILAWADTALRRMQKVGGRFIVFGSSGSRRVPEGWPLEKADGQFVSLLKRMGPLAAKAEVTIAVEQLQPRECNFLNHIGRAASLIRRAGHPNIRLLADLYHMAQVGDTPDDLRAAMDVVAHVEIAEKAERTYPGVKGDDFRPYFKMLKQAGYRGAVSIEARGEDDQLARAFREIARQAGDA